MGFDPHAALEASLRRERHDAVYALVLRHGRPYEPRLMPPGSKPGKRGCCYANAYQLAAQRPELRYVEGYSVHEDFPQMMNRHGWCIDADDRVVDPSWGFEPTDVLALRGLVLPLQIAAPYAVDYSSGTLEGMQEEGRLHELVAMLRLPPL
jgi:hypothetical protein